MVRQPCASLDPGLHTHMAALPRPKYLWTRTRSIRVFCQISVSHVSWSTWPHMLMKAQILTCLWNYKLDHRRPLSAGEMWPHVSGAASGLVGDQLSPQSPAQSPAINKPKLVSNTPPVQFEPARWASQYLGNPGQSALLESGHMPKLTGVWLSVWR